LIGLLKDNPSELQQAYMKWNTGNFIATAPYDDGVFVLNNYIRNWGHLFTILKH